MHEGGFSYKALELMVNSDYIKEINDANVCHTKKSPIGEQLRFCIKVDEGKIVDASYTYQGCPALAASAAAAVETVLGKTVVSAKAIAKSNLWAALEALPSGHDEHVEFSVEAMTETIDIYSKQKQLTFEEHKVYKHLCGETGESLDELDVSPCEDCPLVQNCENDHIIID